MSKTKKSFYFQCCYDIKKSRYIFATPLEMHPRQSYGGRRRLRSKVGVNE
jgi:hypothetical protein